MENIDFVFITEAQVAADALRSIVPGSVIGLDTETYWSGSNSRSRVSLVQIAAGTGPVLVIDLLKVPVEVVREVVENPSVMMAAHNARFDEGMLKSEGLKPVGFVDTLRLARLALRLPSYSLASVSSHLLGVTLDKSFQRSDWRRRPLSSDQLLYAALDARVSLDVYAKLTEILRAEGKIELAMRSAMLGARTLRTGSSRRRGTPLEPLRPLTERERHWLLDLKKWRLEESFRKKIPAYMICPDRTLEELVIALPGSLDALESISGIGPARIAEYGTRLLGLIATFQTPGEDEPNPSKEC